MGSSEEDKLGVPKPSRGDRLHVAARSLVSIVPYLGGAAKELLSTVWIPPLERRRVEWMNAVAAKLKQLENEIAGFKLEKLRDNPLFITVLTQAYLIAIRNHQEEKLKALQNAVVNCARRIDVEEDLQLLFLDFVDSLSPLHVDILDYFRNPMTSWENLIEAETTKAPDLKLERLFDTLGKGTIMRDLETVFQLFEKEYIFGTVVQDLYGRGLIDVDRAALHATSERSRLLQRRTTELGDRFLKYISDKPS